MSSSASAAPRAFDMSQDSQTPPRGGEDDSSPNSSSSSSRGQPRLPRRTIVALNLSSQSSTEDDDEGENAFASLESFLQGKFEEDEEDDATNPAAPKLGTDNQRVSARPNNDDSPNKQNNQQLSEYNSSVPGMEAHLHAERQSPHKALTPLASAPAGAATTTDKVDPILPEPSDTLANDTFQNQENNDANDFVLPDSPEPPPPPQTTTHKKRRNRPLDNFVQRGGNHGSQTLWPSFEAPPSQGRNQLLDRNRRAAQKLQKQASGASTKTSRSAAMPSRKKSRVIPSQQSSLVGSLPQRWVVQSTNNSRCSQQHQPIQQAQSKVSNISKR